MGGDASDWPHKPCCSTCTRQKINRVGYCSSASVT
jgi:hypothetical protein